jgi:hypothetical protein
MFGFCVAAILAPVYTEKSRKVVIRPFGQKPEGPPKERGGHPQRANGVPDVVLAIPEGTLAVLPCLAPVNRRERNEEALVTSEERLPLIEGHDGPLLDCVFTRRVVKDAPIVDDVGFGWVEVAAGRIDAECPAGFSIGFPRGEPHRVAQEPGDRVSVQRCGVAVSSPIAVSHLFVRKRNQARAGIAPEGVGLRRPIQIPARSGETTEMVLGGLVIIE